MSVRLRQLHGIGRFALAASLLTALPVAGQAAAQDWGGSAPAAAYPPPPPPPPPGWTEIGRPAGPYAQGAYAQPTYSQPVDPQRSYAQGGYAQGGYAQGGYAQGGYAQGGYAQGAYAQGAYAQGPYASPGAPAVAGGSAGGVYAEGGYAYYPYGAERRAATRTPQPAPVAAAGRGAPATARSAALEPASAAGSGSVDLARPIVQSAIAYLGYMKRASEISPAFVDGASVAKQVKVGAAYEARQFEEGAIASAAIAALQEPAFIQGVRDAAGADPARAEAIASSLLADPNAALALPGAERAAARAGAALRRQGDRLLSAGQRVKQAAYDVQHDAWSKADVPQPQARLANAKVLSTTRAAPGPEETQSLLRLVLAEQSDAVEPASASPVVARGVALAALAVLGRAGQAQARDLAGLLTEERGGECLKMAKLNLFQCLAVAGPHYEDIFCLGQHAMMDTAQCVIKASGAPSAALTARLDRPVAATPAPVSAWVERSEPAGR